jgi:hypothetical protein
LEQLGYILHYDITKNKSIPSGYDYNFIMPDEDELLIYKAKLLLHRLERLSADSRFAHRASGIRGQILRIISESEEGKSSFDMGELERSVEIGYQIITMAAREIPDLDGSNLLGKTGQNDAE